MKNLLLLFAAITIALLMAEGVARLVLTVPPRLVSVDTNTGETLVKIAPDNLTIFTPAGTRLRANMRVKILNERLTKRDIDIETNSLGYRNRELQEKTLTRVLFLGDSITFEDYAQEAETWVRQVETRSWGTPLPLETINASKGGISMSDELAILEETGISTQPDIVVLAFYLNDLRESYGFQVGRLPGWLDRSYLAWLLSKSFNIFSVEMDIRRFRDGEMQAFADEIAQRVQPREGNPLQDRSAFYHEVLEQLHDWGGSFSDQHWDYMAPLFHRFRDLAEQHDFQPLILIFPVDLQIYAEFTEDYPQRKVAAIARSLDIPVLDLLSILRKIEQPQRLLHDHCHYTTLGDDVLSQEILAFIQDNSVIRRDEEVPPHLKLPTGQDEPFDHFIQH